MRPGKVAILGFSAGGHLAGSLSTLHARYPFEAEDSLSAHSNRPDASLPCFLSSFLCMPEGLVRSYVHGSTLVVRGVV